ncbi:putative dolichyl-diphosphooligosaccharide--protein glycotransferase [Clavispora lusitaniae]|uniref:Dolichyl-diphosphooligosaccharide--protein glycotransferase n=1 Tax=Clavispora lusitaniae TaxID=36911 RepID=A0AA91Q110_CLALS|nr:putative dolichyl-diphosphooligosaccharide--protein glycotransferase [Clavispora lusitaniae]
MNFQRFLLVLCLSVFVTAELSSDVLLHLEAIQYPNAILPISESNLSLISQPNRNHFTLLVLTSTDERHGCADCNRLKGLLNRLSESWYSNYPDSTYLLFAEVDIIDRSNLKVFEFLNLQTVPQIWLIPPSHVAQEHKSSRKIRTNEAGEEIFDNFDILLEPHASFDIPDTNFDDQLFELADWLASSMQKRIILKQEHAMAKFVATFGVTLGSIIVIKKNMPESLSSVMSRGKILSFLVMLCLFVLLGGYSFTTIQQTPFIAYNEKGPIYLSGGLSYQFGVEILLVAGIYFLLASSVVLLYYLGQYNVTQNSQIKANGKLAVLQILTLGAIYIFFSVLTSMFLRKDHGYPYGLLKLF